MCWQRRAIKLSYKLGYTSTTLLTLLETNPRSMLLRPNELPNCKFSNNTKHHNTPHLGAILQLCERKVVEVSRESRGDGVSSTTGRSHGTNERNVHQLSECSYIHIVIYVRGKEGTGNSKVCTLYTVRIIVRIIVSKGESSL